MLDFVAIDFETASGRRDTACAVSLARVRNGQIVDQYSTLINPECDFSPFAVQVHGITPDQVADAPTFPGVAPALLDFIGDDTLVAHNAPFDMGVLARMFDRYNLPVPDVRCLCTVRAARAALPDLDNHRLPTICAALGVALDRHHDAACDTCACACVLIAIAARVGASTVADLADRLDIPLDTAAVQPPPKPPRPRLTVEEWEAQRAEYLRQRAEIEAQREAERAAKRAEREARRAAMEAEKLARRQAREEKRAQREAAKAAAPKKPSARPVAQLAEDGTPLNIYPSVAEAARAVGVDNKCIRDAANGKQRTAAGHRWTWVDTIDDNGGVDMPNAILQSDVDRLLAALKSVEPDKAFAVEAGPQSDGRTVSVKIAGGVLCYVVSIKQGSYIRIETSRALREAYPHARQLANDDIGIDMDMTFDPDAFARTVAPLIADLFDASATTQFGCCNDFIRCSDARRCHKLEDPDYRGCSYRQNLEAGRIFYGQNKTIGE